MAADPRKRAFLPYFRRLADLMGLRDWRFEIDDRDPENADCYACIGFQKKRLGHIWLDDSFLDQTPEGQRYSAVHKLLHAHFWAFGAIVRTKVKDEDHQLVELQEEFAVDAIAHAWAELLPLPDVPALKVIGFKHEA